jgi:hypothetical protein
MTWSLSVLWHKSVAAIGAALGGSSGGVHCGSSFTPLCETGVKVAVTNSLLERAAVLLQGHLRIKMHEVGAYSGSMHQKGIFSAVAYP